MTTDSPAVGPSEGGFTIIEVVVATLIFTVGALATFGLLSTATKNTQRVQATQVAQDRAQQEIEALRSLTSEELALTATPDTAMSPLDPNSRVNSGNATFALVREPPSEHQKLVVNGGSIYGGGFVKGGIVSPGPEPFASGDVSGDIYRYIVWRNDDVCGTACPGEQDFKQVIVAVKLDTPGNQSGERGYVEVQSDFVDPIASEDTDPAPNPSGEIVTAQQFFLSDTPCAGPGDAPTERQAIVGDHLLHNTLGTCEEGLRTGSQPGAPDALLLGAPPDPTPTEDSTPLLYDYSDDSYLEPTPDTDRGLQIRRDDTTDCHYVPTGTSNPESQVHRWVTDELSQPFVLSGKVTLEFHTRTLNGAIHSGRLCAYLFKRHEAGTPRVGTDTLFTNQNGNVPYWTYTPEGDKSLWPSEAWERLRLEMTLRGAPLTIPAGDRLGVALSVERSKTPADAIPVMYDHPRFPTRIEVDTSTPIDGG